MKRLVLVVPLALLLAAAAPAAGEPHFGARAGYTIDPDQIHFGVHAKVMELSEALVFLPNVEVGLGDNATLMAFNGELVYTFESVDWNRWRPYAGGGLGVNFLSLDDVPEGADDSSTDLGLNAVIGVAKVLNIGHEFFAELKLGIEDSPDMKLTIGLSFF